MEGIVMAPHLLRARIVCKSFIPFMTLAKRIEVFWLELPHQEVEIWLDHREINMVMLVTSLAPDDYLSL